MKFEDLENIALEGGGGKGAVYKGAIEALEELFVESWEKGEINRIDKYGIISSGITSTTSIIDVAKEASRKRNKPAILDFTNDGKLKIKGISGSSAGAITAFPLSLGLNSDDIEDILKKYPFNEEFLPNKELHEGKYRMVGMDVNGNSKSLIAEDHFKKLGEDKIQEYIYSFGSKKKIGANIIKKNVRNKIITISANALMRGIKNVFEQIKAFFTKLVNAPNFASQFIVINSYFKAIWINIFAFFETVFSKGIDYGSEPVVKKVISSLVKIVGRKKKILDLLPADNLYNSIGNIIWDRGIYAGFEVRDFFFKIFLLALSKDTHLKRSCISKFDKIKCFTSLGISQKEIEKFSIKFNDKFEVEALDESSKSLLKKLIHLPELLTFEELFNITEINLCVCSTNATTSQPLYFSNYFTPNFPVMEALGASMNFPIAFKPIYNEANVLKNEENKYPPFIDFLVSSSNNNIYKLYFNYNNKDKSKEATRDYNYWLSYVLNRVKVEYSLEVSINGNLSFRSFLPYLRKLIEEKKWKDSNEMSLFYFFYNSAFKGLLIDGGVTNNLPTSIFTFTEIKDSNKLQELNVKKRTLSLKLDNSFPESLKNTVWNYFENDKSGKTLERLTNWQDKLGTITFIKKIKGDLKLKKAFERVKADEQNNLENLSEVVWIKICKELIEEYKLTKKGFTPWNKQVNAISALMSSLQFGMDQGHIENIADNENIIPLYCYGVGTLDFDLTSKELLPLVELANKESKKQVLNYFKVTE